MERGAFVPNTRSLARTMCNTHVGDLYVIKPEHILYRIERIPIALYFVCVRDMPYKNILVCFFLYIKNSSDEKYTCLCHPHI